MTDIRVAVKIMEHAQDLPLPRYMTGGAVGMDLLAALTEPATIPCGKIKTIPTGLQVAVPPGYELQIRPRSGLASKHGIGILNSPGTIDPDYRGEVKIILINLGPEPFLINRGDRIAQMVLCPAPRISLQAVTELPPTERGSGGFGHTGLD
ncbi:MAG TPA: dUTP diphosphatase [Firmicutes bacterium]|nr:dUTP diphosphatase [Bacillota bacterium]